MKKVRLLLVLEQIKIVNLVSGKDLTAALIVVKLELMEKNKLSFLHSLKMLLYKLLHLKVLLFFLAVLNKEDGLLI